MEVYAHLANVLCYLIVSFDCMLYLSFINHHINTAITMITIPKITAKMITAITPADRPKKVHYDDIYPTQPLTIS